MDMNGEDRAMVLPLGCKWGGGGAIEVKWNKNLPKSEKNRPSGEIIG